MKLIILTKNINKYYYYSEEEEEGGGGGGKSNKRLLVLYFLLHICRLTHDPDDKLLRQKHNAVRFICGKPYIYTYISDTR